VTANALKIFFAVCCLERAAKFVNTPIYSTPAGWLVKKVGREFDRSAADTTGDLTLKTEEGLTGGIACLTIVGASLWWSYAFGPRNRLPWPQSKPPLLHRSPRFTSSSNAVCDSPTIAWPALFSNRT
jgi:hypothetical protein